MKSQHRIQIYDSIQTQGVSLSPACEVVRRDCHVQTGDWASSTTPVEMQFPLFLPEKLLGMFPRHVPQIKPGRPTCARLSRVGAVARISSTFSPSFMCRRTRLAPEDTVVFMTQVIRYGANPFVNSVELAKKPRGSSIRRLSRSSRVWEYRALSCFQKGIPVP